MKSIEVCSQGVRGGNVKSESKGYVKIFGENYNISVDAYEGNGNDYKGREQSQIVILFPNGKEWTGNINDLQKKVLK